MFSTLSRVAFIGSALMLTASAASASTSPVVSASVGAPGFGDPLFGKTVPPQTLDSNTGHPVQLPPSQWTLLYFYPKDDTPGCTVQACAYRDHLPAYRKLGVQVIGVSRDSLASHDSFTAKHELNFPLLSDSKGELARALGVEKDGRVSRDTFLIDPAGRIVALWRKVDPAATQGETIAAVRRLVQSGPAAANAATTAPSTPGRTPAPTRP